MSVSLETAAELDRFLLGLDASMAAHVVEKAEGRLEFARRHLDMEKRVVKQDPHQIGIWTTRVMDMEAALETYNRRLGEAKVAAGWVS